MSNCPKCGAEMSGRCNHYQRFACSTMTKLSDGAIHDQSDRCRIAELEYERNRLKARLIIKDDTMEPQRVHIRLLKQRVAALEAINADLLAACEGVLGWYVGGQEEIQQCRLFSKALRPAIEKAKSAEKSTD